MQIFSAFLVELRYIYWRQMYFRNSFYLPLFFFFFFVGVYFLNNNRCYREHEKNWTVWYSIQRPIENIHNVFGQNTMLEIEKLLNTIIIF